MFDTIVQNFHKLVEQSKDPWFWFGLAGNTIFFGRFLLQWIVSERAGRSVVPRAFWYMSLTGAAILFVYAFHRVDAVFVLGQSVGFFVYIRNLVLLARAGAATSAAA